MKKAKPNPKPYNKNQTVSNRNGKRHIQFTHKIISTHTNTSLLIHLQKHQHTNTHTGEKLVYARRYIINKNLVIMLACPRPVLTCIHFITFNENHQFLS